MNMLIDERRLAAEEALQNYSFDDLQVAEMSGWEYTVPGVEYSRVVYFSNPDERVGDSIKGRFTVVFENEQSSRMRSAYATIDGHDVGSVVFAAHTLATEFRAGSNCRATSTLMDQLRFRWTVSYLGCVEYEVCGDGPTYSVELRQGASVYERKIYNGDEAEWQRDVVAAIGLLRRKYHCDSPIPQRVVDAFNAWRASEHARRVDEMRARPDRYGVLSNDDPLLAPPVVVRGAHYSIGVGWIIDSDSLAAVSVCASAPYESSPSP